MKEYIVLQDFKGSKTGADCTKFAKDAKIIHDELGDDLAQVALDEKWIKQEEVKPKQQPKRTRKK